MDRQAIRQAADALAEAWTSGRHIETLPAAARPASLAEAHAIQDLVISRLGKEIGGWKVAIIGDGEVMRGAIFRSRILDSPARLSAAMVPLLGVEAEIAFRFDRGLPAREEDYSEAEVSSAVTAFVAIEVVDSRFVSYHDTPLLDRAADCVSSGALIAGTATSDWTGTDLASLEAALVVDGEAIVRRVGGNAAGHPIHPTVALVNELRKREGVREGQVITAGTYTGLNFVKPGQTVSAEFAGFGSAEVRFEP